MFKKTEESEWTRFSRALGGAQPAAPQREEEQPPPEPELPPTISQAPEATTEPMTPPPSALPEPDAEPAAEEPSRPATHTGTPTVSASLSRLPDLERGETVIGDGATIEGTVRAERSIRIRGSVQGEVESSQRVVVEEAANVKARVVAEHVTVLGEINGSIECTGRVEIAASGRVTGEVTAGTLVIQEGAFFEGHLRMANRQASE